MRRVPRLRRSVAGAALALFVILMGGPPALAAAIPDRSMSGMAGMVTMSGSSDDAAGLAPAHIPQTPVMDCEGSCQSGLLNTCLAVLALVASSVMAAHSVHRLVRGRWFVRQPGGGAWWIEWGPPPWSVLSLSQLSVLRV